MSKTGWKEIYGPEAADLYDYSRRHSCITSFPKVVFDLLEDFVVQPVENAVFKRKHLPSRAKLLLVYLTAWRFDYQTFAEPFPILSYWSRYMHLSMKDLCRTWRGLVQQGLLELPEGHRQGRGLRFDVGLLLKKVREWLHLSTDSQPVVEEVQPEPEPEPWDEQPELEAVPEEEQEPEQDEQEPIVFPQPAEEWDMALPGIEKEVSHRDYLLYFARTRAYWIGGKLTVKAANKEQWTMLQNRYRRCINRNTGLDVVILGPRRSA